MTDKQQTIYNMCMTWRHDFGLEKDPNSPSWSSGMTSEEAETLYSNMEQVYNINIEPLLQELKDLKEGNRVLVPVNLPQAKTMLALAHMYIGEKDEPATN